MIEYIIVGSSSKEGLIEKVNQKTREDWLPQGSPFVDPDEMNWDNYCQAMVREIDND